MSGQTLASFEFKSGAPRHPLYVKTGTPLQVYRP
jgi:hypothetical protein